MSTDEKLDHIITRLNGIDISLAEFREEAKARLDGIHEGLDALGKRLDGIDKYLLDFRNETANRLDIIDSRLTLLAGLYQSLDPRMAILSKAILDFGVIATRLQNEQSRIAKLVEPAA